MQSGAGSVWQSGLIQKFCKFLNIPVLLTDEMLPNPSAL